MTSATTPNRDFRLWGPLFVALIFVFSLVMPCGAADPQIFQFHHDGILGTSLDLQVRAADAAQAAIVETDLLAEIERLRKILSTYDDASEISRVNAATTPVVCSQELLDVLGLYDWWTAKSRGAYNGHLGELIGVWKAAEKTGAPPSAATLLPIVRSLAQPGWAIDRAAHTVTRLTSGTLNVNSLGKGYIISKAIAAARAKSPAVQGILLNIGGDIFASGTPAPGAPWLISVANPMHSEDNAPPLTQVRLTDRAISTSASYERGYTIAGQRYSHIFDPRTGYPATGAASATVITGFSSNANALATTLCVLKPEEGIALARQIPDVDCLIVAGDGRQFRTPRFALYEMPQASHLPASPTTPAKPGLWPPNFQVSIAIALKLPVDPRGIRRPYVAVWVEDSNGKRVRTVAVWGNAARYLPDLIEWWKLAQQDQQQVASVTRATRAAGHYRIAWDGLDDQKQPVPAGTYTVFLEVNRQRGSHAVQSGAIVCGRTTATGVIPAAPEFGQADLTFGPAQ
jgi:thiamine biosynthesis lipoprotein